MWTNANLPIFDEWVCVSVPGADADEAGEIHGDASLDLQFWYHAVLQMEAARVIVKQKVTLKQKENVLSGFRYYHDVLFQYSMSTIQYDYLIYSSYTAIKQFDYFDHFFIRAFF